MCKSSVSDCPLLLTISSLIIGAGPSGLAVAYWMAQYGINARIIDKRGTKLFRGHADGLRSRTLELFDSMGFAHRVTEEGYHAAAFMFWVSILPKFQ